MIIGNIVAIVTSLTVAAVGNIYDITQTVKGIKAGVAVEGFTFLVGQKPSARALYARDLIFFGPLAGFIGFTIGFTDTYATYPFLLFPVLYALKHIQGGLKWRYLLAGGTLDPEGFPLVDGNQQAHSAWQKFIGPWLWNLPKK